MQRFKYPYLDAKNLVTLIPIVCIALIPIISTVIVFIGKKGICLLLASIIASVNFLYLQTLPAEPSTHVTVCILSVALFYSMYSTVIWSSMTLVVPQQGTSVALGIATTVQNVLMTILPLYFGSINESRTIKAYDKSLFSLTLLSVGGLLSSLLVILVDFRTGKRLHLPENHEKVLEAKSRATISFTNSTSSIVIENWSFKN
jgi:hypothetical protein